MKSTTPSTTRFNRFKHHMATLVSTAVLACVLVAPSASMAASGVANLPDTAFAKMCFTVSGLVYRLVQVKDEKLAVQKYEELMEESDGSAAYKGSFTEIFYFGLSKRYVYRGEALKSLLQLHCPSTFRRNH